ncbi:MAG: M15 family metallopeptidase [Treponema sp.]|jgi:hypothetical protein|nr:M15 family metallopeptidase [Treponema sp.]
MGVIRDIDKLNPEMAKRVRAFLEFCKKEKIGVCVIETLRTAGTQAAYYAQGRRPLAEVNALRQKAGLYQLTEKENLKKVTDATHSVHQDGGAIDLCPEIPGKADWPWWNAPMEKWEEIGLRGEEFGLDWCAGGYGKLWAKGWDNPHFEMPDPDDGGAA